MNEDEGQQQLEEQEMQIGKLALALSKAQGEMSGAKKDSENPFFKSKYADLAAVIEAAREPLANNELAVVQTNEPMDGLVMLTTTLVHSSGQYIQGTISLKPTKGDPQGYGSAMTYARRYAYAAIVGVAQVDDDGNEASKPAPVVKISKKTKDAVVEQTLKALEENDNHALHQVWEEFDADEKAVLWGLFNSQQRSAIKALQKGD